MHPSSKSFPSPGSVSASVDSLASAPGNHEVSLSTVAHHDLLAQGSPHSLNSTTTSSFSSSGSLPIHQHLGSESILSSLVHRSQNNLDGSASFIAGVGSRGLNQNQGPSKARNHSRTQSSNSHHGYAMSGRTLSESSGQFPYTPPPPFGSMGGNVGRANSSDNALASSMSTLTSTNHPTIRTNTTLLPQSQGSTYLSSPNDTTDGQGGADSPVGTILPNWASPPMRPHAHPMVSTSVSSSGGGFTSPASLSSPVHLNQPSPTAQHQSYPLPPSYQSQTDIQQQPPTQKPKKEKHTFGGMSASSFLTETLPTTGKKLYPGSKKGAKSHGDISSSSSSSQQKAGKKSGSSSNGGGGGPLSSINTRKQQPPTGAHSSVAIDRAYSSTGSITSPVGGSSHHYMTSPTMSRNNHSSLDAKVMAREMAQGHATEDVWQALCIKVLTLFNGQGLTGAIEDLNDLVKGCLQKRTAFALCNEINELLKNGMLTLNAKLGDVPDEKLVSRLVEVWSFFFGTVLPYFEGVFLPLQIELKTCHSKKMTRKATGSSTNGGGGFGNLTQSASNNGSNGGLSTLSTNGTGTGGNSAMVGASPKSVVTESERNHDDLEPENVRTMALTGFRDLVILPMGTRLEAVFAKLFTDFDASIPVTDTASRMLQMTSVLTSIQSGDNQQKLMEQISNRLKSNYKQFTRRGNRGAFIGLDKRLAPATQQAR
ncbi:HbrB-like-domain-containing protein [Lobosporangium transversale]|uniref:HbrB-like-domain-containing protein n=1 Tax=Lobosporangium transversale TaxID=64571 RepID=A0A1Y2H249_9FUNG|nr:HbrB-like-domain-containing protein [Lobosporangium transversale]ORZ28626.1 HbrB-like-domain-containing protein [Lobosporangium transversale]|eukprot:XP_021886299.1 HbrB-like-domain-containing protein [Lobosporangium transversale]